MYGGPALLLRVTALVAQAVVAAGAAAGRAGVAGTGVAPVRDEIERDHKYRASGRLAADLKTALRRAPTGRTTAAACAFGFLHADEFRESTSYHLKKHYADDALPPWVWDEMHRGASAANYLKAGLLR